MKIVPFTDLPPSFIIEHLQGYHRSTCGGDEFQQHVESIVNIPALLRLIIERGRENVLRLEEKEIVDVLREHIGASGLSKKIISENLRVTVMLDKMDGVCAVCMREYKENDSIGTLICRHEFHADCITGRLLQKNACPLCRAIGVPI
ncbi:Zinc finger, RING/FYVE/PHD-type [Artemisia annua]|uniref:RING-type E3 ubiquitin transferase n=1 Tax=Artemisia annua TaxID=35608 RepID=A0A2U1L756_ARTAN|nr:Zinc finger, RING/FYVE/PHD-type [Artemisia annua]